MRIDQRTSTISRYRTPMLLGVAAALQILDWHSTLATAHTRGEANKMVNWLAQWMSLGCIVSVIKLTCLAMLTAGFLYWRKHKGLYELEFALCLSVVIVVYSGVVFNNYFA
ncbi:DUF5658 family protein [Burkholderia stagnalis]|uniref:DUF5658 family protein n=2 Tax=Burkholderia TaxID=32008 RepID=UPI00057218AD|nr:DUF5658 family protein [Burkholderia stagnalis]KWK60936.1 hypothetical protein WT82_29960 [Burkholderia stagnalis]